MFVEDSGIDEEGGKYIITSEGNYSAGSVRTLKIYYNDKQWIKLVNAYQAIQIANPK